MYYFFHVEFTVPLTGNVQEFYEDFSLCMRYVDENNTLLSGLLIIIIIIIVKVKKNSDIRIS